MDDINTATVEDFRALFGITSEEPETSEPESSESVEEPEVTQTDEPESGPSEEIPETQEETPEVKEPEKRVTPPAKASDTQKQNQAFAKMRSENKELGNTIIRMAEILGLDTRQPLNVLAAQVQQAQTNALAQKRGMDPVVLQRLDALEADHAELTRIKAEQSVKAAFDEITDKFGATNDDIKSFAEDLIREGYDPMAPGANIVNEFISRNFDKIIEKRVASAVAAEQARSAKGSGASKPGNKQGQEDNKEPHAINSVSELDSFLEEAAK